MEEIKQRIKEHEGFRDTVYSDSLGFATIGYGHLVLPNDPYVEGVTYSKDDLEKVFDNDFKIAEKSANELLTEIKHNHIIKGVIIEMCFQLGFAGFCKFKKAIAHMKNKEFQLAAEEMLDSLWAKQTSIRANKLADIVREHG